RGGGHRSRRSDGRGRDRPGLHRPGGTVRHGYPGAARRGKRPADPLHPGVRPRRDPGLPAAGLPAVPARRHGRPSPGDQPGRRAAGRRPACLARGPPRRAAGRPAPPGAAAVTAAGIHRPVPGTALAGPGQAWLRMAWLYLVSRRAPAAAGLLAGFGALLWAALRWHWNVAGGPAAATVIPLVIEAGAAAVVAVTTY